MRNNPQYLATAAARRCAICDGEVWPHPGTTAGKTALCSKKCADRFKNARTATADGYAGSKLPPDNGCNENPAGIFPKFRIPGQGGCPVNPHANSCYRVSVCLRRWRSSARRTKQAGLHRQSPQDQFLHEKFYSTWRMPDKPPASCCNTPTATRRNQDVDGNIYAKRREDGKNTFPFQRKRSSGTETIRWQKPSLRPAAQRISAIGYGVCFDSGGAT